MSYEIQNTFEVKQYEFSSKMFHEFNHNHFVKDYWPLVYILSDGKEKQAYVGETTDSYARMKTHLASGHKNKLTSVHLITSDKFNKSATLDIESNLIKYMSGDGQYKLLNGNLGLANHNYYQKHKIYWEIFTNVWDELRAKGITKHSIEHINNSDLFKYSPYKSLTKEQRDGLYLILKSLLDDNIESILMEGGAGTGKTILAVFLFKILATNSDDFNFKEFEEDEENFIQLIHALKQKYPKPKMGLVVPMASFRSTLKKVFKNIKGLSAKMVIGPAEVSKNKFDILVVDESHRLRRRVNLGTYFGAFDQICKKMGLDASTASELDWIAKQSDKKLLFYDEAQSIKPSDAKQEDFDQLKKQKKVITYQLKSQFRVKGGNAYVSYVDKLLDCNFGNQELIYASNEYEFLLFDSLEDMINQIKKRNDEVALSRLIAGYSWKWVSKNDPKKFDIVINDIQLRWNATSSDWINSENSVNEVGCIHTTQGYDLNYAGIIFGKEIDYDPKRNEIVIIENQYFDKNGKNSIKDASELKSFIINIYKTILLRSIKGTYVYACNENLRNYLKKHVEIYRNQNRSQSNIIYLTNPKEHSHKFGIPLFDLKVAAGEFGEIQNVKHQQWIQLPPTYKPSEDLFACQVIGESMNKIIPNGSICLFRKYKAGSRNGLICLVEHTHIQDTDYGSCYTVKEYQSNKRSTDHDWEHDRIILKPRSFDVSYQDLVLSGDELEYFRVIGIFECVLDEGIPNS